MLRGVTGFAVGDFDEDGIPDLITGDPDGVRAHTPIDSRAALFEPRGLLLEGTPSAQVCLA